MPHVHHPDAATEVYERVAVDIDEQRALRFLGEHRRRDPNPRRDGVVPPLHQSRLFGPGISVLILVDSSIVATSSCRANSFQYTLRRLPSDTPERDSRARCLHRPRFLGEREQAEKLVRYVGSEEGRDLSMVVGGVDFNHVAADDLEAGEAPHELLRLATREAPDLRTPHPDLDGARGIEEVLFDSPPERRAVGVALPEIRVPGVGMRIELHEGQRPVDRSAASAFSSSRVFGRRMKVRTSEKRGVSKESAGSYLVKRSSLQCRIRTPSPALWPPRTGLSALDQTGGATRRPPE